MFVVKFKKGETFLFARQGNGTVTTKMSLFEHETDCVPVFQVRV